MSKKKYYTRMILDRFENEIINIRNRYGFIKYNRNED